MCVRAGEPEVKSSFSVLLRLLISVYLIGLEDRMKYFVQKFLNKQSVIIFRNFNQYVTKI
jgi:hypothetical protein